MTNRLPMSRLPLPGFCGTDAIIPDTGGITGIGTIIMYSGTDAIIRRIISTMPEDGTKADTIIIIILAVRCAAAVMNVAVNAVAGTAAADTASSGIIIAITLHKAGIFSGLLSKQPELQGSSCPASAINV